MDSLEVENKIYKDNCHMQREKVGLRWQGGHVTFTWHAHPDPCYIQIRQLAVGSSHIENAKLRTEVGP